MDMTNETNLQKLENLKFMLKVSEEKRKKQKERYDCNIDNLMQSLAEFEITLQKEKKDIVSLLKCKDNEIQLLKNSLDNLKTIINDRCCDSCKWHVNTNDRDIERADSELLFLPELSLPDPIITSPLKCLTPGGKKRVPNAQTLAPVEEDSELTFSSNLQRVHADLNPGHFHAALNASLQRLKDDQESVVKNVSSEEKFKAKNSLNGASDKDKASGETIVNHSLQCYTSEFIASSFELAYKELKPCVTQKKLICFADSLANESLNEARIELVEEFLSKNLIVYGEDETTNQDKIHPDNSKLNKPSDVLSTSYYADEVVQDFVCIDFVGQRNSIDDSKFYVLDENVEQNKNNCELNGCDALVDLMVKEVLSEAINYVETSPNLQKNESSRSDLNNSSNLSNVKKKKKKKKKKKRRSDSEENLLDCIVNTDCNESVRKKSSLEHDSSHRVLVDSNTSSQNVVIKLYKSTNEGNIDVCDDKYSLLVDEAFNVLES